MFGKPNKMPRQCGKFVRVRKESSSQQLTDQTIMEKLDLLMEMVTEQKREMAEMQEREGNLTNLIKEMMEDRDDGNARSGDIASVSPSLVSVVSSDVGNRNNISINSEVNGENLIESDRVIEKEGSSEIGWRELALGCMASPYNPYTAVKPNFRGGIENPCLFLEKFEEFWGKRKVVGNNKLIAVLSTMKHGAEVWAKINRRNWDDYENFKADFLKYFWNTEKQMNCLKRVMGMQYDHRKPLSMSAYFGMQIAEIRTLEMFNTDEVGIDAVMKQFPREIRTAWRVSKRKTTEDALELLTQEEEEERKEKQKQFYQRPKQSMSNNRNIRPLMAIERSNNDNQGMQGQYSGNE